jgi:iron complex transport system substrate-binding protein
VGDLKHRRHSRYLLFLLILLCVGRTVPLLAYPVAFTDSDGRSVVLEHKPERVISLVPSATEIIFKMGAGEAVVGLTHHDTRPPETNQKAIVGGFLRPSLAQMDALEPDVIFLSSLHQEVREHFAGRPCRMIDLESRSVADLYRNIETLGAVFSREAEAKEIVLNIQGELQRVAKKVERIPREKRKRVMRVMGVDRVMTPGEDSFQNDFIRAAGGIFPQFGKKGNVVDVAPEEWTQFNPQVIYGCGGDREVAVKFFSEPGWKDVEAVRTGRIVYFPCALTCRASVHTGEFVGWLAATIYEEEFASEQASALDDKRLPTKPLDIALPYVRSAGVAENSIFGFPNKTLVVEFKEPMRLTSTLDGERKGILTVGNHYSPPPCWSINHRLGFEGSRNNICKAIGKASKTSCFLFTGANMGNLSVQKAQFKAMTVYALVTAGVESNAMRMAADEGRFYEPGTINVVIMTNRKLSSRARARAIITATEAKTTAMQDLDVRSSADPQHHQATGTGTDEVLVVEGKGPSIDNTGGHCKMGELIAKAVYDGVKEAAYRQNGMATGRSVFRRLRERHLDLPGLLGKCDCPANQNSRREHLARLEEVLLQPRYASFIESAFALSDAYERGQVTNLEPFEAWCRNIAEEIAGSWIKKWKEHVTSPEIPIVMRLSLNALLNGLDPKEE